MRGAFIIMSNLKVGLQLYSIRDKMEQNMDEALKNVKAIGYDYVEFAGYFGKTKDEVKEILDKYNLKCISVHQGYDVFLKNPEENVEYLKTIGAKYCAIPWLDISNHKGHEKFEKTVSEITYVGKLLKDNEIQLLYHNHDFEFNKYDGKYLIDWLYETIPSDLLKPEFDTCWIKYAGCDPRYYLKKFRNNIDVVHFKDFVCSNNAHGPVYALIDNEGKETAKGSGTNNDFKFKPVGEGVQNWLELIKASESNGAKYVITEQDQWYDEDSMDCAARARAYLKSLGI